MRSSNDVAYLAARRAPVIFASTVGRAELEPERFECLAGRTGRRNIAEREMGAGHRSAHGKAVLETAKVEQSISRRWTDLSDFEHFRSGRLARRALTQRSSSAKRVLGHCPSHQIAPAW